MLAIYLFYFIVAAFATPFKHFPRSNGDRKDFLVSKLPGLFENIPPEEIPLMFAGQLELYPENNTHYFYWKFVDQHKIPEAENRTIFWLNGGPGCSSMDGALMEAGPFRINEKGEVTYNDGSWHKSGDIVFVDQPSGTGFSYSDVFEHELNEVSAHFLTFLRKYFELFPEDASNEIFLAGESYAGQYIPYIANGILNYNKNALTPYNLKSLLIGNGWISPNEQSLSYLPYSVQAGIISASNPKWSAILKQHEKCQKIVDKIDFYYDDNVIHDFEVSSSECEAVLNLILDASRDTEADIDQACFNMYDYTLKDSYPSCGMNWPPDLTTVTPFLNNKEVQDDLNLNVLKNWKECSGSVSRNFGASSSLPAVHLLPGLLEQIEIVLFHGNRDIICNYIGAESMIKKLKWNGKKGFDKDTKPFAWVHNDTTRGYIKSERNLTFINVFDSSHMVPFDLPEVSRALMDLATKNYDEKELEVVGGESKRALVTYLLGERQAKIKADTKPAHDSTPDPTSKPIPESTSEPTLEPSTAPAGNSTTPDTSNSDISSGQKTSRITRLIQLLVIAILVWGIVVLYSSYKSRPSSIIKSGSSGRKKNVQWADQLRQFQEDDDFALNSPKSQSIFSKAFSKLTGGSDGRGNYAPTSSEDIELDDRPNTDLDDFIIDSDDEEQESRTNSGR